MTELWAGIGAFLSSAAGVGAILAYARTGLLDVPNHRSSHVVPTPRGGGLAMVAAFVLSIALVARRGHGPPIGSLLGVGLGVALLTLIGWFDDHHSASVSVRLPVHVGCGLVVALLVGSVAPAPGWLNVPWMGAWAFWTVASINIVNFMDGIDGMVASQGLVYGIFLRAIVPTGAFASLFGTILAAVCLGFLLWNWAPARIFMGDVGSGPLGMLLVIGGVFALQSVRPLLVFLPLFPLFFDALATLVIRRGRGERLTEAHRSHLYQRVANGGIGHSRVSLVYALAAAVGAALACALERAGPPAIIGGIASYVVAVVGLWLAVSARFPLQPAPRGNLAL